MYSKVGSASVGSASQSCIFVLQSHRVHFSFFLLCLFVQLWGAKEGFGVSTYQAEAHCQKPVISFWNTRQGSRASTIN